MERKQALIIRLSSMGDIVLASVVNQVLSSAGYQIDWIVKEKFSLLLAGQKDVRKVYCFQKIGNEKESTQALWSKIEKEQKSYDLILDLQNSWRTFFWRGILKKFGPFYVLPKARMREFAILFFRMKTICGYGRGGRMQRYVSFVQKCAGLSAGQNFVTNLQYSVDLEKFHLPKDYIALVPASAWQSKIWPYFSELAKKLSSFPIVILGGKDDEICSVIEKQVGPNIINLQGKTSIAESAAILKNAKKVIGSDTGMIHIAEAVGKDVVVIEGPTEESMGFSPYRPNSQVLGLPLLCRPCSKSGKICYRWGSRKCLNALHSEKVFEMIEKGEGSK